MCSTRGGREADRDLDPEEREESASAEGIFESREERSLRPGVEGRGDGVAAVGSAVAFMLGEEVLDMMRGKSERRERDSGDPLGRDIENKRAADSHLQSTQRQSIGSHFTPILPLDTFPCSYSIPNFDVFPLGDQPDILEMQFADIGVGVVELSRGSTETMEEREARVGGAEEVREDVEEGVKIRVVLRVGV